MKRLMPDNRLIGWNIHDTRSSYHFAAGNGFQIVMLTQLKKSPHEKFDQSSHPSDRLREQTQLKKCMMSLTLPFLLLISRDF